jgi:hypothetical protein
MRELTINAAMFKSAISCKDASYQQYVEEMHSMPAFYRSDNAWLSFDTYKANVPDEELRTGNLAEWSRV